MAITRQPVVTINPSIIQRRIFIPAEEQDGTGSIVFGTNNVALVSTVLGIAGRKIDADEQDERSRQKAKELQQQKQAQLDALAGELYPDSSATPAVAVTLSEPATAETSA